MSCILLSTGHYCPASKGMVILNNALRDARESSGKTQQEVASEASTTVRNYRRIEYGQNPGAATATLIARAVGKRSEDLFQPTAATAP